VAFRIVYNVEGLDPTEHRLRAFAARAVDPAPALALVADALRGIMGAKFDAQGKGKWPPLAESTVAKKGNDTIGVDEGAMRDSLTKEGAEGATSLVLGDELIFGTHLTNEDGFPYPMVFNSGRRDGSQPARPLFEFEPEDLRVISKGIQAYLVGVDRTEFGLNRGGDKIAGSDLMPKF
jgi:phage gpG-like protein